MFNPARLSLARRRRGFTKKALAAAVGLDQRTLVRHEAGESDPLPETVESIAKELSFPVAFFYGGDIDEPTTEAVSFRSLKALLARDRDAALAAASFAFVLSDWVGDQLSLPSVDLLTFKEDTDPESASRLLRQKWKLGERRVSNMIHLLESKGVRVFALNESTRCLDAFSMWRRETPFVFLNTTMTSERSRFDAAHELGHLVLHKHGGPQGGRVAEDQANQFASAFLMPKADVLARLPRVRHLEELAQGKKHWGVSVSALNHRLHRLGIITDWQYRTFCIQITERFGQGEPYSLPREQSMLWEKAFQLFRADGITKHKIARSLSLPVAEVETLVFGLRNMQSIDGRGEGGGGARATLRLVN